MSGCIMAGEIDEDAALEKAKSFAGLKGLDLAKEVTTDKSYQWTPATIPVHYIPDLIQIHHVHHVEGHS